MILALALAAGMARAETVVSELALAADPRLPAEALSRLQPPGWAETGSQIGAAYGLGPAAHAVSARPMLVWDRAIKGGISAERFELGGPSLTAEPESRAIAGMTAGLGLAAVRPLGPWPCRGVPARAGAWPARRGRGPLRALGADLSVLRAGGRLCLTEDFGAWRFADLGLAQQITRRVLATSASPASPKASARRSALAPRRAVRWRALAGRGWCPSWARWASTLAGAPNAPIFMPRSPRRS